MPQGKNISVNEAKLMIQEFRQEYPNNPVSVTFEKSFFTELMDKADAKYLRVYFGVNAVVSKDITAIITAVDDKEYDILDLPITEFGDHANPSPL